ncbi:hypothetical protein [Caldalkalibacillus salinus]|uniref:hypothetical protein n=1 Tax=Caldalkalibacillus salinus TaxID=2803787 RepID=UPI0019234163|nr:hypothetical protein [Caldalkalibacillus salinus]
MTFKEYWEEIYDTNDKFNQLIGLFWQEYAHMGTWQFWVVAGLFLAPLVLLYFTVDRRRIFEIFFFGYTVHIFWGYTDIFLGRSNYFIHTYFLAPMLPFALNMTASFLPVSFLLLYQYCTNHNKNFYIYAAILSAVFSFLLVTIEVQLGLAELRKGIRMYHIFIIDIIIVYFAYGFTRLCVKLRNQAME